jgi:hypothetical protein
MKSVKIIEIFKYITPVYEYIPIDYYIVDDDPIKK